MTTPLVEVRFEPGGRTVSVPRGVTILAAAEAAGVDIATGCTRGMCGTDPVRIVVGEQGLGQPADQERGTLERMGLGAGFRLSCSALVLAGPITVETDAF